MSAHAFLPGAIVLRVAGLTRTFGEIRALDNASFSVRSGEILGLIGPNGAGKTTLLECVAGVLPLTSGTIEHGAHILPVSQRGTVMFYVPDGIAPWPERSVQWVLNFSLGFFDGDAEQRDRVIRELDLRPLMHTRVASLSKGQRKRVLLGVGLLTPQPILLFDEPFDGLDLRQTGEVARVLRGHAESGRTIILSIHQILDAARVCDRFVLLSEGRVRTEGTLDELTEETFLALT
jgi:ABC-2 type transport system ATP-binding protein